MFNFVFVLLLSCPTILSANSCSDSCDSTYFDSGLAVQFCGTDLLTHSSFSDAFSSNCYSICGVMTYYPGSCGCPNNCFSDLTRGKCSSGVCICSEGYSGLDCSQPASTNSCSGHGVLIRPDEKSSAFGFNYCLCDNGWTGTDCSSPEFRLGNVPWGTVVGSDSDVYTSKDVYKDAHPVWNISVLATIHITLKDDDYLYLLQPWNLYNESYKPASVSFDNGHVQETFEKVGFRIKGAASRMDQKKGWYLKFDEFVSGQSLLDIDKLGFKAGSVPDDTLLKTMMYGDFSRAMGVPVQRASYALMYVNGVFVGLYFMHEVIDEAFFDTRLKNDDGSGNAMKLYYDVTLQYFGSDDTYYKDKAHVNDLGVSMYYYEQSQGNGNWTGFIDLLSFFNNSSDETFAIELSNRVDTTSLLKNMVVESFMMAHDNLASGNNFYCYNLVSSNDLKWQIVEFDFDECLTYNSETNEPDEDPDIIRFFIRDDDSDPLLTRILELDAYTGAYLDYYSTFITEIFGAGSPQQPSERLSELYNFILPWVSQDKLWQISYGMTTEKFTECAMNSVTNLNTRYKDVYNQLQSFGKTL